MWAKHSVASKADRESSWLSIIVYANAVLLYSSLTSTVLNRHVKCCARQKVPLNNSLCYEHNTLWMLLQTHVCASMCTHAAIHGHEHRQMHICTRALAHTYTYICPHTHAYACTCTQANTRTHMQTHASVHTCTLDTQHTNTQTHNTPVTNKYHYTNHYNS